MVRPSVPIRVLYIEYGIGFGGSVVSLAELTRALREGRSVDPLVLSAQDAVTLGDLFGSVKHRPYRWLLTYRSRAAFERWMRGMGVRGVLMTLAMRLFAILDLAVGVTSAIRLLRRIRHFDADIVHLNNGFMEDAVLAALWARRPVILHFRGFATGGDLTGLGAPARWGATTIRATIAISNAVERNVVRAGVPPSLVRTIYNPIRAERYAAEHGVREETRARHGFGAKHIVVAIFGRVTRWKGQLEFLGAIGRIEERCTDLRVMIVGDESDSEDTRYAAAVRERAASLRPGSVIFAGYQNRVQDYYWASDIVVHNSVDPEPFGRVVSEAMACSRAVVAMAEGGPAEIITDDVDGVLVPARDEGALAEAIGRLCLDAALRARIGSAALETVKRRFSADAIASQVHAVYRDVLERDDP